MLQKIAKKITNNFGLKCIAVIVAVIFWLVIVNVEDPEKTLSFSVEVEISHTEYLTDMGKTYEIANNSNTISFTATGKRSVVEKLDESDFTVTANMEDMVEIDADEGLYQIPVTITPTRYSSQITVSKGTKYIVINVEDVVSETFDIEIETNGELPDGYSVSSLKVSPATVTVSGAQSLIDEIAKAVAVTDVSSMHEDFVQEATIVLYDESGNEIPTDRLTLNHSTATVSAEILMEKTISVTYETTGVEASGYKLLSVSGTVTEISVLGKESTLENIDSVTVTGAVLSITNKKESFDVDVDIGDYLPSGVTLANADEGSATVTVEIEGTTQKEYAVPAGNITLNSVPGGCTAAIEGSTVTVILEGYPTELEQIKASDITGSVDLSGLEEGTHSLTVTIDGDYTLAETVTVTVLIEANSSGTTGGENTSDGE